MFGEAAEDHALQVLKKAVSMHGKPASVLTSRGSQFYASEKEAAAKGATKFEKELVALGIRHVLARANRTQTNGKLARFCGELQRRLPDFDESAGKTVRQDSQKSAGHVGSPFYSAGPTDPVTRLVHWHNHDRTHMLLGESETPAKRSPEKCLRRTQRLRRANGGATPGREGRQSGPARNRSRASCQGTNK